MDKLVVVQRVVTIIALMLFILILVPSAAYALISVYKMSSVGLHVLYKVLPLLK